MDAKTKAEVLRSVVARMRSGATDLKPEEWAQFVEAQNDGYRTGPEIGAAVPNFQLPDQKGQLRSLEQMMGPKGLLLVFSRSADW
jgi:hypothetical protein